VSLIGLVIATYTDLKERIVTNKLNFGLAILGLLMYSVVSIMTNDITPILFSIFGLFYGFMFGWLLWKGGVFAGGDVKLFMALGALNPFTPALIKSGILSSINIPLFPVTLFVYALVSFLPYGMFVVLYKLSKNKPFRKQLIEETKKRVTEGIHLSIFSGAAYTLTTTFGVNSLILIPAIIIWGIRKEKLILTIIVTLAGVVISPILVVTNTISTFILVVVLYGIIKLMLSMRPLLVSEIKVSELVEGMIPAKTLVYSNKKVVEIEPLSIKKIISQVRLGKAQDLLKPKDEIVSAMKARGVTDDEIKELKKLAKQGLIKKTIQIKESMPFVPTMLLGYILCLILGDAIWALFFRI
jgi:Flp pilus assembly protein protease CpaA